MSELPKSTTPSGLQAALRYTGIPTSWLTKRPKLPSRNWLIFLTTSGSIISYYIYDRRQCKQIRQAYVDKVKHLADAPLGTMDVPRKVTVYGARWPGDEDYDRSLKYFKRYVKPILVAAAVDYELIYGKKHGDIAIHVSDSIKQSRRIAAGLEKPKESLVPLPHYPSQDVKKQREMAGGILLVGRPTFKEYMAGLKDGWSSSMAKIDREEQLGNLLSEDGHFDEPEEDQPPAFDAGDDEPAPLRPGLPGRTSLSTIFPSARPARAYPGTSSSSIPSHLDQTPISIPSPPPLSLIPFRNLVGFRMVPLMIWEFFNERQKVESGAKAGLTVVEKHTRALQGSDPETGAGGDLDFDQDVESYYKSSLSSSIDDIDKARDKYYATTLPQKLATARALARNTREPTKEEISHPPPTEVELRTERLKKELRWRGDEAGWKIVQPTAPVQWDARFQNTLRVFDRQDDTEEEGRVH